MTNWGFPKLAFLLSPITLLLALVSIIVILWITYVEAPAREHSGRQAAPGILRCAGIGALGAILMGFASVCGNYISFEIATGPQAGGV